MGRFYKCDRCRAEAKENTPDFVPSGWEVIIGAQLCAKCAQQVHEFVRPLPQPEQPYLPSGLRWNFDSQSLQYGTKQLSWEILEETFREKGYKVK